LATLAGGNGSPASNVSAAAGAGSAAMAGIAGGGGSTVRVGAAAGSSGAAIGGNAGGGGLARGGAGGWGTAQVAGAAANSGQTAGMNAGSAGTTAGAGVGEAGAGAGEMPAFVADGEPISAPATKWTWIPFAETKCRDGSAAGIAVSLNSPSKKLVIFLQGGGSCFDAGTCSSNPANIPAASQLPNSTGILDRGNMENPVKDWNYVYVPYCTGDIHIGDKENVTIPGVDGMQQFVGRRNLEAFLKRVVPTFKDADQVLLTGISAGGFGAISNWEFVQWAFGTIPVTMIDDSGPTMSNQFVPQCLYDLNLKYWGLDNTILKLCGSDCDAGGDYTAQYAAHVGKRLQGQFGGLVESNQDQVIRWFFGIGTDNGKNDCMGALATTPMDGMLFEQGLLDFRTRAMANSPNLSTYFPQSNQHTWLYDASLYSCTTSNVRLIDWVSDIVAGKPASHVGQ
jgi:hypothetical protein